MARKVVQVRYYGDGNENNSGVTTGRAMITGTAFQDYLPAYQIGIQAMPGAKFRLNNSLETITIGTTGIYELNIDNLTEITNLTFDRFTVQNVSEGDGLSYIIVDLLYEN